MPSTSWPRTASACSRSASAAPPESPSRIFDDQSRFAGYKRDKAGQTVMTRLNEEVLARSPNKTGGRYFHSTAGDVGVPAVAEELERLDKAEFESHLSIALRGAVPRLHHPGLL